MPSPQIEKVPEAYKAAAKGSEIMDIYNALLPNLAPHNTQHPFLDVFQLRRSCFQQNCSYNGGHRSCYVNHWKARLLLNTLCEVKK